MCDQELCTPVNAIGRENLKVLLRNTMLNDSVEFTSESDTSMMETDSPMRQPLKDLQPISKKLFHSPLPEASPMKTAHSKVERRRRKRKQNLIPDSNEKIKRVYVEECEKDGYSPNIQGGMRKKMLISLFHNKEYSMDFS